MKNYIENILVQIIKAQNTLLKGGKIHCSQKNISSMKVETILNATNNLFSANELATLLGVDPPAMRKSYNKAIKRMKFWKKHYWSILIGGTASLFCFVGGIMYICNLIYQNFNLPW